MVALWGEKEEEMARVENMTVVLKLIFTMFSSFLFMTGVRDIKEHKRDEKQERKI